MGRSSSSTTAFRRFDAGPRLKGLVAQRFGRKVSQMQPREESMSRHLADHRAGTTGSRVRHFLRLARAPRETWKRTRGASGAQRVVQFLRIARGRVE